VVGNLVRECIANGKDLQQLTQQDLLKASPSFDAKAFQVLTPEAAINRKNIVGGTATTQVTKQINGWKKTLQAEAKRSVKKT
jgi:argininosuccinate lyase